MVDLELSRETSGKVTVINPKHYLFCAAYCEIPFFKYAAIKNHKLKGILKPNCDSSHSPSDQYLCCLTLDYLLNIFAEVYCTAENLLHDVIPSSRRNNMKILKCTQWLPQEFFVIFHHYIVLFWRHFKCPKWGLRTLSFHSCCLHAIGSCLGTNIILRISVFNLSTFY